MTGLSARRVVAADRGPGRADRRRGVRHGDVRARQRPALQQPAGGRSATADRDARPGDRRTRLLRDPRVRFLRTLVPGATGLRRAWPTRARCAAATRPCSSLLARAGRAQRMWARDDRRRSRACGTTGRPRRLPQPSCDKAMMDDFRQLNRCSWPSLPQPGAMRCRSATWLAVGVAALLSIVLVLAGVAPASDAPPRGYSAPRASRSCATCSRSPRPRRSLKRF